MNAINAQVVSVSKDASHRFSKQACDEIELIKGEGVVGDAHRGTTVKHRSRVKVDPSQPNLRQVHLLAEETITELQRRGFKVLAATMGENITTSGINLLDLPRDTILTVGQVHIQITGLRNPCRQLDDYQKGLTAAVLDKGPNGELIRKAGIMGVVLTNGTVKTGDRIGIEYPALPHKKLERV